MAAKGEFVSVLLYHKITNGTLCIHMDLTETDNTKSSVPLAHIGSIFVTKPISTLLPKNHNEPGPWTTPPV